MKIWRRQSTDRARLPLPLGVVVNRDSETEVSIQVTVLVPIGSWVEVQWDYVDDPGWLTPLSAKTQVNGTLHGNGLLNYSSGPFLSHGVDFRGRARLMNGESDAPGGSSWGYSAPVAD